MMVKNVRLPTSRVVGIYMSRKRVELEIPLRESFFLVSSQGRAVILSKHPDPLRRSGGTSRAGWIDS